MKKLFSLLMLCGIIINTQAQKLESKDVPAPVTDAFNKTHPSTKDADWKKDGKYYKVEYDVNKLNNTVSYDINGVAMITEEGIPVLNLPKCVADYVRTNYPRHKIKKASKVTDAEMVISYIALVDDKFLRFNTSCDLITL